MKSKCLDFAFYFSVPVTEVHPTGFAPMESIASDLYEIGQFLTFPWCLRFYLQKNIIFITKFW